MVNVVSIKFVMESDEKTHVYSLFVSCIHHWVCFCKWSVNYSYAQLIFLKIISYSRAVYFYAGFQFHVLYSDLVQVLILLIDKLVILNAHKEVYVMT